MSNKSIKCGVSNCKYNDKAMYCNLNTITIAPEIPIAHNKCETECASFELN